MLALNESQRDEIVGLLAKTFLDLNPTENLWSELERRIRRRPNNTSINELESALQEEWSKITK